MRPATLRPAGNVAGGEAYVHANVQYEWLYLKAVYFFHGGSRRYLKRDARHRLRLDGVRLRQYLGHLGLHRVGQEQWHTCYDKMESSEDVAVLNTSFVENDGVMEKKAM